MNYLIATRFDENNKDSLFENKNSNLRWKFVTRHEGTVAARKNTYKSTMIPSVLLLTCSLTIIGPNGPTCLNMFTVNIFLLKIHIICSRVQNWVDIPLSPCYCIRLQRKFSLNKKNTRSIIWVVKHSTYDVSQKNLQLNERLNISPNYWAKIHLVIC